jgi:monoamine oxidase
MGNVTRREILKRSAAFGAASLMGWRGAGASAGADYDVVIVGAGIAGMTAARLLGRAGPGLKVLVLEAQERVGGRLLTLQDTTAALPSHGIEVGAQVIHGTRAATWELIEEFKLQTRSVAGDEDWLSLPMWPEREKRVPDPDLVKPLMASVARAHSAHPGGDLPFSEFLETLWLDAADRELVYSEALSWSAEPDQLSTRAVLRDGKAWDDYWDGDFQIIGGHRQLVDRLAADLKGGIQLASQVHELFWSPGIAGVGFRHRGLDTTLTCRQLIVTLPIGVLRSGAVKVTPEIPAKTRRAIDSLDMGKVVVVPMIFKEPFWQSRFKGPGAWTSPAGRQQFWIPQPASRGHPGLQGWFAGSAAQELSDLGPEAGLARVLRWLEEASGESRLAEKLSWHHFEDWVSNPYTRGSYSITRPGGHGLREELAKPVGGSLYFAGEATAPAPHYQTVHGAYLSGKRVAQQVIEKLRIDANPAILEDADEAAAPILEPL